MREYSVRVRYRYKMKINTNALPLKKAGYFFAKNKAKRNRPPEGGLFRYSVNQGILLLCE